MDTRLIENDLKNILRCENSSIIWKMTKNFLYEANKYNRLSSIDEILFRYEKNSDTFYKKNYLWSTEDKIMHLSIGNKIVLIVPLLSSYVNKCANREERIDRLFSYLFFGNVLIKKWNMDENELPYMLRTAKRNHRNTIFDCIIDLDDDSRCRTIIDPEIYLRMVNKETRDKTIINHIL